MSGISGPAEASALRLANFIYLYHLEHLAWVLSQLRHPVIVARMDERKNRSKSGGLQGAVGCCTAWNINYIVQRYLLNQNSTAKGMVRAEAGKTSRGAERCPEATLWLWG